MSTSDSTSEELPERPRGAETWYDVLDVGRDVDHAALLSAYERALALVEGRHLGGYFLLDPRAIAVAKQDIEAAFAILSDDERRSAYDRSLVGDDVDARPSTSPAPPKPTAPTATASTSAPPKPTTSTPPTLRFLAPVDDEARVAKRLGGIAFAVPKTDVGEPIVDEAPEPASTKTATPPPLVATATVLPTATMPAPSEGKVDVKADVARRVEIPQTATPTPPPSFFSLDGEVNGQTIRRIREARRMSIEELAEATKIRRPYLQAIEEQDLEALPSRVYLRGFLTQIARVLRVDKIRLADGYLAFIARFGR